MSDRASRGAKRYLERSDEELMELIEGKDADAFEVIFDRHSGAAFSLAFRMSSHRGMAEDVAQEAFLSLWRSGARYDPTRGSVRSWILGTVHHRAIDAYRREVARQGRDVRDDAATDRLEEPLRTSEEVERRDVAARLRGALDGLPTEQRRVIELAYFGGLSHSEIAESLRLPIGTVKGRMRLGLGKLGLVIEPPRLAVVG